MQTTKERRPSQKPSHRSQTPESQKAQIKAEATTKRTSHGQHPHQRHISRVKNSRCRWLAPGHVGHYELRARKTESWVVQLLDGDVARGSKWAFSSALFHSLFAKHMLLFHVLSGRVERHKCPGVSRQHLLRSERSSDSSASGILTSVKCTLGYGVQSAENMSGERRACLTGLLWKLQSRQ